MKYFIAFSTLILLGSCNSKDQQFCNCLQAGEELNEHSLTLFNESVSAESAKKLKELKAKQKKACADYQTMGGPEMLERKKLCQ